MEHGGHAGYRVALAEAEAGAGEGGIPIGAALFRGERLLGAGHNRRLQRRDPSAHAEIEAFRAAGLLDGYADTTLFSTLTPCAMCCGAVVLFGVPLVVIGQTRTYPAGPSLEYLRAHGTQVVDLGDERAVRLLDEFIQRNPAEWAKDNGEWSRR
jgi:cytosine deaminase